MAFHEPGGLRRTAKVSDAGPTPGGGGARDIDAAVRQVIGDAVDAGEVIDLFAAAGLDAARLDILSEDFLNFESSQRLGRAADEFLPVQARRASECVP